MRTYALALPFLLAVFGTRATVAPLGDRIARVLVSMAPPPPKAEASGDEEAVLDAPPSPPEPAAREPRRVASRAPVARPSRDDDERAIDAAPRTVVIPASAVQRALEKKDVGATNAKNPPGARLHGVSRYGVGLRDGDVVIAVAGRPTPTVAAMIEAAMGAAAGGATSLTGTVQRGETTFTVVLPIPRQ